MLASTYGRITTPHAINLLGTQWKYPEHSGVTDRNQQFSYPDLTVAFFILYGMITVVAVGLSKEDIKIY